MFLADDLVGEVKHLRAELLVVLVVGTEVAGAPAGVDDLPLAAVDADRVPGVVGFFGRERRAGGGIPVAVPLTVAADEDALEPGGVGNGFVHLCVALAHGFAAEDLLGGRRVVRSAVVEEAVDVVSHVVVAPGEDGAGLVGGRVESTAKDMG